MKVLKVLKALREGAATATPALITAIAAREDGARVVCAVATEGPRAQAGGRPSRVDSAHGRVFEEEAPLKDEENGSSS